MQTTFKVKLLQFVAKNKKQNQGFTLIELLVVIIIIGILSAVALPTFLNQAGKARQAGAESILGAVNRGQQAYRVEEGNFADTYSDLQLGYESAPESDGYTFETPNTSGSGASEQVSHTATSGNTNDQPSLCGTATLNTTSISEEACTT